MNVLHENPAKFYLFDGKLYANGACSVFKVVRRTDEKKFVCKILTG